MDLRALIEALFGADAMPDDAQSQLLSGVEAYEMDTSATGAKVAQLEQAIATLQAENDALKIYNFDKLMNGPDTPVEQNPGVDDGDDEQATITTDDLFGEPGEPDTDTDTEDKDKD